MYELAYHREPCISDPTCESQREFGSWGLAKRLSWRLFPPPRPWFMYRNFVVRWHGMHVGLPTGRYASRALIPGLGLCGVERSDGLRV